MRIELYEPADESSLITAMSLCGVVLTSGAVAPWTKLERALAFDWAIRDHLSASDNVIKRRDKPSFITAAETTGG